MIVECPECGARNSIDKPQPGKAYRCGKCEAKFTLPQTPLIPDTFAGSLKDRARREAHDRAKKVMHAAARNKIRVIGYGFMCVVILVGLILLLTNPSHEESPQTSTRTPPKTPATTISPPTTLPPGSLPTIAFHPKEFKYTVSEGKFTSLSDVLNISNSGKDTLNWSVLSRFDNIALSPTSGSSTGESDTVNITIDIKDMSIGEHEAEIAIIAKGASILNETVPIKINIIKNPAYVYINDRKIVGGDGKPIELANNPDATNPTFSELLSFISKDTTDTMPYTEAGPGANIYADYAEKVHNNAEASGIKAALVKLVFSVSDIDYVLNAFETTDRGLIYVDCSNVDSYKIRKLNYALYSVSPPTRKSWDTAAYIEINKEYGRIELKCATSSSYSFYEEYPMKWKEYEALVSEYNADVARFTTEIETQEYEDESQELAVKDAWNLRLENKKRLISELNAKLGNYWVKLSDTVKEIYIHW